MINCNVNTINTGINPIPLILKSFQTISVEELTIYETVEAPEQMILTITKNHLYVKYKYSRRNACLII